MNSITAPIIHTIPNFLYEVSPYFLVLFISFCLIILSIVLIVIGHKKIKKKNYGNNYDSYNGTIISKEKSNVVVHVIETNSTLMCKSSLPLNTKVIVYINKFNSNDIKVEWAAHNNFFGYRWFIGGIFILVNSVISLCISGLLILSSLISYFFI